MHAATEHTRRAQDAHSAGAQGSRTSGLRATRLMPQREGRALLCPEASPRLSCTAHASPTRCGPPHTH